MSRSLNLDCLRGVKVGLVEHEKFLGDCSVIHMEQENSLNKCRVSGNRTK